MSISAMKCLAAVSWLTREGRRHDGDSDTLADLLAAADAGDEGAEDADDLAAHFRADLLGDLDEIAWAPAVGPSGETRYVTSLQVIADGRGRLDELVREAFDLSYPARLGVGFFPADTVNAPGVRFLAGRGHRREGGGTADFWGDLLRPGDVEPWTVDPHAMGRGFLGLVGFLDHWLSIDRAAAMAVIRGLGGDERAAIIPVIAPGDQRRRRSPARLEPGKEAEGGLVLARIAGSAASIPPPPDTLRVAFIRHDLLTSEQFGPATELLGIRRFDTDTVLGAIVAAIPADPDDPAAAALTRFAWNLLEDSDSTTFGVPGAVRQAADSSPGSWAWFRTGSYRTEEEVRRARGLARLPLPSTARRPQAAGRLVFGEAWADWLLSSGPAEGTAAADRGAAYRDLEAAARTQAGAWVVAGPAEVAASLGLTPNGVDVARLHAFLLRIGVWEVPPVEALVERESRPADLRDPWQRLPGRAEHIAIVAAADPAFASKAHRAVTVGRDFRLLWDPRPTAAFLRALARGIELYQACARAELFCSGCGRHGPTPATPTPDAVSYLLFTLRSQPWLEARQESEGLIRLVPPPDAWYEPGAPSMPGLLQSPLGSCGWGPSWSRASRSSSAWRALPRPPPSASTACSASYAIATATQRDRARCASAESWAALAPVKVLAASGPEMRWVSPEDARQDDGRNPVFKGLFSRGDVWFVVLKQDQTAIRTTLGVPAFEVKVHQHIEGDVQTVTDEARPFLHDLAPYFMALLVFHSVGGPTLELDSEEFRQRVRRLASLEVRRVDHLSLDVEVVGRGIVTRVGDRSSQDAFVAEPTSAHPVLFHDLPLPDWQARLRSMLGPLIANVLGSDAYAATFQLLLLQADGQRERFVLDLGIGDGELQQVRAAMGHASGLSQEEARRWRTALGAALRVSASAVRRDGRWHAALRSRLGGDAQTVLEAGEGDGVRHDDRPDGALAALVRAGVALGDLDAGLRGARLVRRPEDQPGTTAAAGVAGRAREGGDRGPRAQWPIPGRALDTAGDVAASRRHPVRARPGAGVLAGAGGRRPPVGASRPGRGAAGGRPGVRPPPRRPGRTRPRRAAALVREHPRRGRLANDRRRPHRPVAARPTGAHGRAPSRTERPGVPNPRLAQEVVEQLGHLPSDQDGFANGLESLLAGHPGVASELAALVRGGDPLRPPPVAAVRGLFAEIVGAGELDRVRAALQASTSEEVETVRRAIQDLRRNGVSPLPVPGLKYVEPLNGPVDPKTKRHISRRPRIHDQEAKDKAGKDAEVIVVRGGDRRAPLARRARARRGT